MITRSKSDRLTEMATVGAAAAVAASAKDSVDDAADAVDDVADAVSDAALHALFSDTPERRYLVVPNAISADHADRIRGEIESISDRSEYFIARTRRKSYSHADAETVKAAALAEAGVRRHTEGKEVKKEIDTGSEVATPENMNEPRIQELLKPKLQE